MYSFLNACENCPVPVSREGPCCNLGHYSLLCQSLFLKDLIGSDEVNVSRLTFLALFFSGYLESSQQLTRLGLPGSSRQLRYLSSSALSRTRSRSGRLGAEDSRETVDESTETHEMA